ncbi:MAG: efflux RND transporter periplasmic adaptor subunit [Candidatus Latescibacterota bacterium]|nr:MAG: efflux RND transporter periplasmic adaptor subunit [Candidatus Latescibacterota bacterium]
MIVKKTWFWVVLLVAAVALVGWRFAKPGAPHVDIPTAEVVQGDLLLRLTETGELKAKQSATITAPNDKLITFLAPEGSWVEKGDLLVQLESGKYEMEVQERKSAVEVARAQLDKARSDLQAQLYKEESAKKQYEALLELQQKGFAMESEVEEARLNYLELQSKTGSFQAAVKEKRSDVSRARNAVKQIELKLESNAVFAPIAGLVVYAAVGNPEEGKKVELGMTPYEGQPLMQLPDISTMQVLTEVNEMDIDKVQVGQPVEIRLDAVQDALFHGKVARIGTLARHKVSRATGKRTGVKVFTIDVDVEDADERLRPGLSAIVSIHVGQFNTVTYAPVEAIFNRDGSTVAYVKRGDRAQPVVVECGRSNDHFVIIRSGLKPGDRVFLAQPI